MAFSSKESKEIVAKMVFSNERFEQILVESIELKNEHQLRYILEDLKVNPDEPQKSLGNLSIFEKVLKTPCSRRFIELCVQNGSDFYRKSNAGVYPLYYAIHSLSADNLKTIVQSSTTCEHEQFGIHYSMIINQKLDDECNYLHYLIERLTKENYVDIAEMIKILLMNKISPNSPNRQLESPFYLMLMKLQSLSVEKDLIDFFIQHSNVDFHSYKENEIIEIMEELGLKQRILFQETEEKDVIFMNHQLEQWNEKKFTDEFENFKSLYQSTSDLINDCAFLLEAATARNMQKAVTLLLASGANASGVPRNSKFNIPPAFIACYYGHHEILSVLLRESSLKFRSSKSSLLHQICSPSKIRRSERQKCFDLLIADRRCSQEIINGADDKSFVPLFYACHYGFDELAIELLRRGAFIGHESVINNISREVLSDFLDESIKSSSDVRDKNCEIHIDYRFLLPENVNEELHYEVSSIREIAANPNLMELVLHPVIASFLHLKWRKIKWLVYFNLLVYFLFMMFLGFFIINFFHHPVYNNYKFNKNQTQPRINGNDGAFASQDSLNDLDIRFSDDKSKDKKVAGDSGEGAFNGLFLTTPFTLPTTVTTESSGAINPFPCGPYGCFIGDSPPRQDPPPAGEREVTGWGNLDGGSAGFGAPSFREFLPTITAKTEKGDSGEGALNGLTTPFTAPTTVTTQSTLLFPRITGEKQPDFAFQLPTPSSPVTPETTATTATTKTTTETPQTQEVFEKPNIFLQVFGFGKRSKRSNTLDDSLSGDEFDQLLKEINQLERNEKPNVFLQVFGLDSEGKRSKRANARSNILGDSWRERFDKHLEENTKSYRICLIGVILMTIYELIQCVTTPKKYFFQLSNWLDIILIYLSYTVLINSFEVEPKNFKRIRAVTILVMAAQSIQLIAKVSILSMSLHMAIFKRVCATFLKTIALYLILILAFAMSFYTMDDNEDEQTKDDLRYFGGGGDQTKNDDDPNLSFSNPFISVITTVRMMLSDFDTFKLDEEDHFQGFIFLLFVVLITVVLFNLLNALAISDTNNILKDAELVDTKKRISILNTYEKLFYFCSLSCANILPEVSSLMMTPNKSNVIKVKNLNSGISDVRVLIHKTGTVQRKFVIVQTSKLVFWKQGNQPMTMGGKTIRKIIDFVREKQQNRKEKT